MLESNITGQPCPIESGRINQIDSVHAQRRGKSPLEKQGHFDAGQKSSDQNSAVKKETVVNHSSVDIDINLYFCEFHN